MHWVSVTPGLPSFGFHLLSNHRSLFTGNLLICVSTPAEAALCHALIPDCLAVPTPFSAVVCSLLAPPASELPIARDPVNAATAFIRAAHLLHGANATCPFLLATDQLVWLRSLLQDVTSLPIEFGLFCLVLSIPVSSPDTACDPFTSLLRSDLPCWACTSSVINSATHGDAVSALRWVCIATRPRPFQPHSLPQLLTTTQPFPIPFGDYIRSELCSPDHAVCRLPPLVSPPDHPTADPFLPYSFPLNSPAATSPAAFPFPIFDPTFPSPEPCCHPDSHSFALPFSDPDGATYVRHASPSELLDLYSAPTTLKQHLLSSPLSPATLFPSLRSCIPFATAHSLADSVVDSIFYSLDHDTTALVTIPSLSSFITPTDLPTL